MAFPDHTPFIQKSLQLSTKSMGECSYDLPKGLSGDSRNPNPLFSNDHSINPSETSADKVSSSSSVDHSWEVEENSGCLSSEDSGEVHNKMHHAVRQSGGKVVDGGRVPSYKGTDNETDQGFSCDDSQEMNNAHNRNAFVERFDSKEFGDYLLNQDGDALVMDEEEGGSNIFKSEKGKTENPDEDFKIKRIEEWISMIDLENCIPLLDTVESSHSTGKLKKVVSLNGLTVAKLDGKTITGMEAAKNYVSSMTSTFTSAQLANHGLVVTPVLSAFVHLRVLNLSGNSIERINAHSFPRGLHMLDLSKNNISSIEGLRELTRLRVLDLSYNRIYRIGHGLASCSSLKEVYLACNKISDVEGLHRLLKLNILDLSFNKISTTKCLDQLAANYNSLHTISLEGNPALRNVGDEQVKKYVQVLLPHLVYYNRQPIKTKEVCDRTARSTLASTHQFDKSFKMDHNKLIRRGKYNHTARHRQSSHAATHSRSVGSPKSGKGRREHIPLTGAKGAHHRNHNFDIRSNLVKLRSHLSMH